MLTFGSAYSFCFAVCELAREQGILCTLQRVGVGVQIVWSNGLIVKNHYPSMEKSFTFACQELAHQLNLGIKYDPTMEKPLTSKMSSHNSMPHVFNWNFTA